jgi:hypothetical protein
MMDKIKIEVGFGKADIWGVWESEKKLADELNVRAFAVKTNDGKISIIAVFDLGLLWPSTCEKLSRIVGKTLKIPSENIIIFTTQNHAVETIGGTNVVSTLSGPLIRASKQAIDSMQTAKMAMVNAHPKPALNFLRRVRIGKFGAFTFFFGLKKRGEGKADASHLVKMAIKSLAKGVPYQYRHMKVNSEKDYQVEDCPVTVRSPLFLKKANDDLLQGIFFRNLKEKPIGSIVRFAAHPITSNLLGRNYNSGDYPLYMCAGVWRKFSAAPVCF